MRGSLIYTPLLNPSFVACGVVFLKRRDQSLPAIASCFGGNLGNICKKLSFARCELFPRRISQYHTKAAIPTRKVIYISLCHRSKDVRECKMPVEEPIKVA